MFNWNDYLQFAREQAVRQEQSALRSAVSRAYYSAYHHAKLYVRNRLPEVRIQPGLGSHKQLWGVLQETQRTKVERNAGNKGDELRRLRTLADYEADHPVNSQNARLAIDEAAHVLRLLSPPSR